MPICKGRISHSGEPCKAEALENLTCCKKHEHMENYTDEMIKKSSKCTRCSKFKFKQNNYCDYCLDMSSKNKSKSKIKNNIICKGIAQNGTECGKKAIDDTEFCKNHQYMKDYTEEMFKNLEVCSGCKNRYHGLNGHVCDKCKNRGKTKKNKIEDDDKSIKNKCEFDDCENEKYKETNYCKIHKKYIIEDSNEKNGFGRNDRFKSMR